MSDDAVAHDEDEPRAQHAELVDRHRHVRRRPQHGRASAWRTSAGTSSTTCRRRCCSTMAELADRARRRGRRASRWWSTSAAGRSSPTCRTRSPRCDDRGLAPRVVFLDAADEVLVRRFETSAGRTRCRATAGSSTASPPSASCSRDLRGDADLVIDTSRPQRPPAARQGRRTRSAATDDAPAAGRRCCRSASSTACRSTPTSCSTCASCPTRTGCPSCGR